VEATPALGSNLAWRTPSSAELGWPRRASCLGSPLLPDAMRCGLCLSDELTLLAADRSQFHTDRRKALPTPACHSPIRSWDPSTQQPNEHVVVHAGMRSPSISLGAYRRTHTSADPPNAALHATLCPCGAIPHLPWSPSPRGTSSAICSYRCEADQKTRW
jgi:hypothetical protein